MPKLVLIDIFRSVFVCMRGNECACVLGWTLCEYKLCRRKMSGDEGLVGWALSCIICLVVRQSKNNPLLDV